MKESAKEKVKKLSEQIEKGVHEVFDSGRYKNYLDVMSRFHNYSANNQMLIYMQKPDATNVAGFNTWKNDFNRHVKKGEKGIRILAPGIVKDKGMNEAITRDGKEETKPLEKLIFFSVSVFDVSQTDGEPLPTLSTELTDSVKNNEALISAVSKTSPVPIEYKPISGETKGYYVRSPGGIVVKEGMSESQTLKTLIHEISHARLHSEPTPGHTKELKEIQAESVAYVVSNYFGVDTSEYSFAYIASWSIDEELKTLKASLDVIQKESSAIIKEVDKDLKRDLEAMKEEHDEPECDEYER